MSVGKTVTAKVVYYGSLTQKQITEVLEDMKIGEVKQSRSQQLQEVAATPRMGEVRGRGFAALEDESALWTDF